jgi:aryl-alcohol dehydrogenase-like predicted oxidoreductase
VSKGLDSGSAVARLVLGTAGLGMAYGLAPEGEAHPRASSIENAIFLLRTALEAGVGAFDTAPAYGEAETRVGMALGEAGAVWTKVSDRLPGPGLHDRVRESLEKSLGRLRRKRIDLLQWHNWNASVREDAYFRQSWGILGRDSRISALGATTYGSEDALLAVSSGLFTLVQVEWNLLNQRVVRTVAPVARAAGVRLAVRSVYLRGVLTSKGEKLPDQLRPLQEPHARVARLAADLGMDVPGLALRAALDHEDIDLVLIGVDRVEELRQSLSVAEQTPLPSWVWPRLRELDLQDTALADPRGWDQT